MERRRCQRLYAPTSAMVVLYKRAPLASFKGGRYVEHASLYLRATEGVVLSNAATSFGNGAAHPCACQF